MIDKRLGDVIKELSKESGPGDQVRRPFSFDDKAFSAIQSEHPYIQEAKKLASEPLQNINSNLSESLKQDLQEEEKKRISPEILVNALLLNLGRRSSDRVVQDILAVAINRTRSALDTEIHTEPTNYMESIVHHVTALEGVTKVQILEENFPESATIIVKLDLDNFRPDESNYVLSMIDDIIEGNKPKALDRLEVIYHNKVVYV